MMVCTMWTMRSRVEGEKKILCDLLDGIWEVSLITLGWLSYLMKGSIVETNGEI